MAGVTPNGFVTKTQPQIVSEIKELAQSPTYFGEDLPVDPDSFFGNLVEIMAAALKDSGWDLLESVNNNFNRDFAEEKNLDDLGALRSLPRRSSTGSTGALLWTGTLGSTVSQSFPVADNDKRYVLTDEAFTYDRTSCYAIRLDSANLTANTTYTVNVEGSNFIYASGGTVPTLEELVIGLNTAIGTQATFSSTTEENDTILVITSSTLNNILTVIPSANMNIVSVSMLVNATAEVEGDLTFLANSLTTLSTTPVGTISVTNPSNFTNGRLAEGDEDYRRRFDSQESNEGKATRPRTRASILAVEGVSSVLIIDNETLKVDSGGRPANSFECFVTGGAEQAIAEAIWTSKPTTIKTHGNITKVVIDENGDEQFVSFSRETVKYAYVNVVYSLYNEEVFPSDGETAIAQSVSTYGNSLLSGVDLIPKRFEGQIFSAVDGILDVTVSIALVDDPTTVPALIDYVTTPISILASESVNFDVSRINVSV